MRFIPIHARTSFGTVTNTLFTAFVVSSAVFAAILWRISEFKYIVFQLGITAPAVAAILVTVALIPWLKGEPRFGIGAAVLIAVMHTAATVTIAALAASAQPHMVLHPELRFALGWVQPGMVFGVLAAQAMVLPVALRRFSR